MRPTKIFDPAVRRLLDLVEIGELLTIDVERYLQGATVTLTARDGRRSTSTVFAPRGAAINGIEWRELEEKLEALCPLARMSPDRIRAVANVCRDLDKTAHMRELLDLLSR